MLLTNCYKCVVYPVHLDIVFFFITLSFLRQQISMSVFLFTDDEEKLKELGHVRVLHKRTVMPYSVYKRRRKGQNDEESVQQYATLVGQTCSERMLLFRS